MNENNSKSPNASLFVIFGIACVGIVIVLIFVSITGQMFVTIGTDEKGLVLLQNEPTGEILETGSHFVFPNERVLIYKVGSQTYLMGESDSVECTTNDGQRISVDVSVVYSVDPKRLPDLYTIWRNDYRDGFIRPVSRNVTRDTLKEFSFDEIARTRDEIEEIVAENLEKLLSEQFLILIKFELLDIRPSTP